MLTAPLFPPLARRDAAVQEAEARANQFEFDMNASRDELLEALTVGSSWLIARRLRCEGCRWVAAAHVVLGRE